MPTPEEQIAAAITDPARPTSVSQEAEGEAETKCRVVWQQTKYSMPIWGLPLSQELAKNLARKLRAKGYHWVILVDYEGAH